MEEIRSQIVFLAGSFLSGVAVMLAYEVVNIFRGLFHPGVILRFLMDMLFFAVSGVMVFFMIFVCNNGTIRSFFVFAFAVGAVLYRRAFGTALSDCAVKGLRWIWHTISRPFVWGLGKIRKVRKKLEKSEKKA